MNLGICEWDVPAAGLAARFQWTAERGLQGLEIDLENAQGQEQLVRDCSAQWNIHVPTLGVNACCKYSMCRPSDKNQIETALAASVKTALELGIGKLQIPSFAASHIESTEDFNHTVDHFKFACRLAEGTDLLIGTENALSAEQQLELINRVGSDQFKIYFDTRNAFATSGLNSAEILEKLYPHVCEVHVKDGMDNGPASPLGEGNSGFHSCAEILTANSYDGWILLENNYKTIDACQVDIETAKQAFYRPV